MDGIWGGGGGKNRFMEIGRNQERNRVGQAHNVKRGTDTWDPLKILGSVLGFGEQNFPFSRKYSHYNSIKKRKAV
jgi:hypothetical protein